MDLDKELDKNLQILSLAEMMHLQELRDYLKKCLKKVDLMMQMMSFLTVFRMKKIMIKIIITIIKMKKCQVIYFFLYGIIY